MSLMLVMLIMGSSLALCFGGIWLLQFVHERLAYRLGSAIKQHVMVHRWQLLEPVLWNHRPEYLEVWLAQQAALIFILIIVVMVPETPLVGLAVLTFIVWRALQLYQSLQRAHLLIVSELPAVLDLTAMLLQAGSSLSAALVRVAEAPKITPLTFELMRLRQRLQSGVGLEQALQQLANRLPLPEVNAFVMTAMHAIKNGSVLSDALLFQAQQRRQEALLRMEKRAQEAPVKLLLPLVLCFFPVSFLLLLGPVFLRFSME